VMADDRDARIAQLEADLAASREREAALARENATLGAERADARQQQTALSEVLRIIASSPTDLPTVLTAVAQSAARALGVNDAIIYRVDGDSLRVAAGYGPLPSTTGVVAPANRGSVIGRAIADRRTVHIIDIMAESESEFPHSKAWAQHNGYRT